MAKITSSSFGLSSTGARLKGTSKTLKISAPEKSSLKILNNIDITLKSILNTLTGAAKEDKKLLDKQRKEEENKKRSEREKGLESKVFDGIKAAAKTVMKPFTSIWDWITNFFWNVFLGKVVIKLLNWFSDPKNKDKIQSIIRFFKDWWPTMLGAYILFGTSFGKLARGLVAFAGKSVIGLGKIIGRLLFAVKKGRALKALSGAGGAGGRGGPRGGGGGRGLGGALGRGALFIGSSLLAGYAIDKGVESLMGGGENQDDLNVDVPETPEIPMLNAATGGLADIGKIFGKFGGGAGLGAMFGPLGMLMGMGMGAMPQIFQGLISGKKGTDKIPAMLTDGEFVMSKGAVQKYGVDTLQSMNAAGGGSGIPKIVKGIPHAAGGGYFGTEMGSNTMMEGASPFSVSKEQFKKGQDVDLSSRVKRIEAQMQVQNALATGKGIQTAVGKGYGTTYGGRQSILVRGGTQKLGAGAGYNAVTVPEINVGGMRYFAQQKGQDIIYTSNFARGLRGQTDKYGARNQSYGGSGGGLVGGYGLKDIDKKNLPKTQIMMGEDGKPFVGYLSFKGGVPSYQRAQQRSKGMLESMTDFFDPGGTKGRQETLNARSMRLAAITDLESYRRRGMKESEIKKMMNQRLGPNGYSRAVNDFKAKQNRAAILNQQTTRPQKSESVADANLRGESIEHVRRGGTFGQLWRTGVKMFGSGRDIDRVNAEDKASQARVKQRIATSQGKYYSSSDGKYYANYAAAKLARDQRRKAAAKPPVKPAPRYNPAGGGMGGGRGSGVRSGSRPAGNTPPVRATSNSTQARQTARQRGVG
jgi:hypothetical protein